MFGRGGRGDLARFFAHGDLRLVILHLIAEKPRHGYEIIKAIEERVGGAYSPSPGTVYPTLTLLEELGHVTVTPGEGTKRLHTITAGGAGRPTATARPSRRSSPAWREAEAAAATGRRPRGAGQGGAEARPAVASRPRPAQRGAGRAITAALEAATAAVERA